jgi:hypothetical protein
MTAEIGIEDRIEQRRDRTRQPRGDIQRTAIFHKADELAEPFVELRDQETVEGDAVLVKPEERTLVHQRNPSIAQRHHIVAPCLLLQHRAFTEPFSGGEAREGHGLAAPRYHPHPDQA